MAEEERYTAEREFVAVVEMPCKVDGAPSLYDALRYAEDEIIPAVMCETDVPAAVSLRHESCDHTGVRNGLARYRIRGSVVLLDIPVRSQEEAEKAADRMADGFRREAGELLSYSIISATVYRRRERTP